MSVDASTDHFRAALVYEIQNRLNWVKALLIPAAQARANIKILEKTESKYDRISEQQRNIIDASLNKYHNAIELLLPQANAAYPNKVQAAPYVPVDPCAEIGANIECNLNHVERYNIVAKTITRLHQQSDFTRAVVLDPRWWVNVELYSISLRDLLEGRFSSGDLMEVMTDSAETALATGRVGGYGKATRRNVTAGRLRLQHEGRNELRRQAEMANRLSPSSRAGSVEDFFVRPEQRIAFALQQAQLIQNDLQNKFTRDAQKAPEKLALLNLRLERTINQLQLRASKANLVNTFVPNYAQIFEPQINALAKLIPDNFTPPRTNMSSYDSPSVGGNWLAQQGSNPFTNYQTDDVTVYPTK